MSALLTHTTVVEMQLVQIILEVSPAPVTQDTVKMAHLALVSVSLQTEFEIRCINVFEASS